MSSAPTTADTYVDIDGRAFLLNPDEDVVDLMSRIEDAARSEGVFVRFDSRGVMVSALISKTSRIVIAVGDPSAARLAPDLSEYARSDWDY